MKNLIESGFFVLLSMHLSAAVQYPNVAGNKCISDHEKAIEYFEPNTMYKIIIYLEDDSLQKYYDGPMNNLKFPGFKVVSKKYKSVNWDTIDAFEVDFLPQRRISNLEFEHMLRKNISLPYYDALNIEIGQSAYDQYLKLNWS